MASSSSEIRRGQGVSADTLALLGVSYHPAENLSSPRIVLTMFFAPGGQRV